MTFTAEAIGRWTQELVFGIDEHARVYGFRNVGEPVNRSVKRGTVRPDVEKADGRSRRGFAAQSLSLAVIYMAGNIVTIGDAT